MIVVIDYGLGNLRSVAGALEKIGQEPLISHKVKDIEKADKLILPGVGAFADGIKNLKELGLIEPLTRMVMKDRKPILGICLGFQLMAKESFEFGHHKGLSWINASVRKLEPEDKRLPVPHVGWNDIIQAKPCILFEGIPEGTLFYYVHSYYVECENRDDIIGECEYGNRFTAAARIGNVYATQFHPEKSQLFGLTLLENFVEKA